MQQNHVKQFEDGSDTHRVAIGVRERGQHAHRQQNSARPCVCWLPAGLSLCPDVEGCAGIGRRRALGGRSGKDALAGRHGPGDAARAGELRPVRVPDTTHQAMQALVGRAPQPPAP